MVDDSVKPFVFLFLLFLLQVIFSFVPYGRVRSHRTLSIRFIIGNDHSGM